MYLSPYSYREIQYCCVGQDNLARSFYVTMASQLKRVISLWRHKHWTVRSHSHGLDWRLLWVQFCCFDAQFMLFLLIKGTRKRKWNTWCIPYAPISVSGFRSVATFSRGWISGFRSVATFSRGFLNWDWRVWNTHEWVFCLGPDRLSPIITSWSEHFI